VDGWQVIVLMIKDSSPFSLVSVFMAAFGRWGRHNVPMA